MALKGCTNHDIFQRLTQSDQMANLRANKDNDNDDRAAYKNYILHFNLTSASWDDFFMLRLFQGSKAIPATSTLKLQAIKDTISSDYKLYNTYFLN